MKEFTCPFCNVPYEHFTENWEQFTCTNCGAILTPEILFNFKIEFENELNEKLLIIKSIQKTVTSDDNFQMSLKEIFNTDNSMVQLWTSAGMPLTLNDLKINLDFHNYDKKIIAFFPPLVKKKKLTSSLILYFLTRFNNLSKVNKELYDIIINRIYQEDDLVVLQYYCIALEHYNFDLTITKQLLFYLMDKFKDDFFAHTDFYCFGMTKFPSSFENFDFKKSPRWGNYLILNNGDRIERNDAINVIKNSIK